ncbi:MAG TPA: glycosyltransferase family 4 protein [Myxococcales bacterium]|jgi:glycosyltransferase involved in cell wall biosynthesis|nr:glycosyltransferase family 4 protein [Myxococcales bacterium]
MEGLVREGVWLVLDLDAKKRGSMEQQLIALAARLRAGGISVTYVFARPPAPFPGDELRALGVDLRALDFHRPLSAADQLAGWLRARPASLVHFHFIGAYSPLVAVARLSGAKVAVHQHTTLVQFEGATALRTATKTLRNRALNWLADRRIAVSRFVADSVVAVENVPPSRVLVVENGIDLSRFERVSGEPILRELQLGTTPLVACVARFMEEKGVESAIRAVPHFARGAHLALVGEGPEEQRYRAITAQLGVETRVHFLGLRHDVERILAASRAVVVPSHWDEAFGLAVVEGMASAKPVVVTRSGAMPEIVGDTGIVVPKRDPQALAGAVNSVLADEHLAAALGEAARRRAEERYSMRHWVDHTVAAYEQLCPGLTGSSRAAA